MQKVLSVLMTVLFVLCCTLNCVSVGASEGERNLAEGISYSIETGEPITNSYALFSKDGVDYNKDNGCLTDGKTASPASKDGWYKAYKGKTQSVVIDLQRVCSVTRIEAGFLHSKDQGIFSPRYVRVLLSDDGTSFGTVTEYQTGFDLSNISTLRCDYSVKLPFSYSARFVKIEFNCDSFVFCDEIRVIGDTEFSGDERTVTPDAVYPPYGYLRSVSDIKNIVKIEVGTNQLSKETALPYIAYLGSEDSLKGRMFDSIALLPDEDLFNKTKSEEFINDLFSSNGSLSVVDTVVAESYSEMGISRRFPVFIGIPYPNVSDEPFGDIDNNGSENYSSNLRERLDIVKWYVDNCVNYFNSKEFRNIYLAGFYWTNDEIDHSRSNYEEELFKRSSEHIRSKWLLSVADFSYLSAGFDKWEQNGFSGAVMRPNAAFAVSNVEFYFKPEMFDEFTQTAINNRLGVGIETDIIASYNGDNYFEAGRNYERYLFYGYKNGYSDALCVFTQGNGLTFEKFCNADVNTPKGQYLRRLYDQTFNFINGLYKNVAPTVSVSDIRMVAGDSRITAAITVSDEDSYRGDLRIDFPDSPKNGVVAVSSDKETLIYRADDGFVGEDTFTVRVSDGFNYSEEVSVTVTVEPNSLQNVSQEESEVSQIEETPEKDNKTLIVIAIFALVATVFVITIASKTSKNKKR